MEYAIILIDENTKLTEESFSTKTPIEFKFIGGHGEQLDQILNKELELADKKIDFKWKLNLKSLSLADRKEIIKKSLENKDLIDSTLILNIFNLLNGYKEFNNEFFSADEVIVNKISELIDLKSDLRQELNSFCQDFAKYYFSIFRSVGVTDFPANNLPEIIPLVYQRILLISDFISLSNIFLRVTSIPELIFVENSEFFLSIISQKYNFANGLIKDLGLMR